MNAPDRYDKFVVPDDLAKVKYVKDPRVPNAATFIIQREDHTLGNILRMQLHRDPHVIFAGYKIPHPLQYQMEIKVQTDGSKRQPTAAELEQERIDQAEAGRLSNKYTRPEYIYEPIDAFNAACDCLRNEMQRIEGQWQAEVDRVTREAQASGVNVIDGYHAHGLTIPRNAEEAAGQAGDAGYSQPGGQYDYNGF